MWNYRNKKPAKRGTRSKLVERLDRVFSEYIRLRDSFNTQGGLMFRCISCGKIKPYSALIFKVELHKVIDSKTSGK